MLPPGRRRERMSTLTLILSLVFLFVGTASAAGNVIGIDFGTEYIKAALVKPGIPLEIVPTKDSKRKEISAVAFKASGIQVDNGDSYPERFYGSDAMALAGRFPGDVFPNLKTVLEHLTGDPTNFNEYLLRRPGLKIAPVGKNNLAGFTSNAFSSKDERPFSVEELLAMLFKNVRENAITLARGSSVDDVVITVPAQYTADERRALTVAADMAGLRVQALITDGLAVGLNYATTRTFPTVNEGGKPEYHVVFDMGAGSTTATVVRFQGRTVKDIGRFNKTIQEVAVLGTGWDVGLGGDALNGVMVDHMIEDFLASPQGKHITQDETTERKFRGNGRVMAKLWRDAERARQVLSANTETVASFESFYEDIDFKYRISRSTFEKMTAQYVERIAQPIHTALRGAGLALDDLDSIIVHGGVTRTPFVQKRLESLVGAAKLRGNVNADEAAVFGAAFKGAGLSPSFRVKEIRDQDTVGYPYIIKWEKEQKTKSQKIFSTMSQVGVTKEMQFPFLDDFEFSVTQQVLTSDGSPNDNPCIDIKTSNLTASVSKLIDKFGCTRDDIKAKFLLRLNPVDGIPQVVNGSVSCEVEGLEKKGGVVDDVKGFFGFGSKKDDQKPLQEGGEGSESAPSSSEDSSSVSESSSASASSDSASTESASPDDSKVVKKKRTEIVGIEFKVERIAVESLSSDELKTAKARLAAWDSSDRQRRKREEALNTLEAYLYRVRDQLEESGFISASTDAERSQIQKLRDEATEWLSSAGDKAPKKEISARYDKLKSLVTPLTKRRDEASKRPELIEQLKTSMEQTGVLIKSIKDHLEQAAASSSSAAEAAAKAATESSTATASESADASADPLAELEDEPPSFETTTSAAASETPVSAYYTTDDLSEIEKAHTSVSEWLEKKLAAQSKLSENQDAAFTAVDLQAKAKELNDAVTRLVQRKTRQQQQLEQAQKSKSAKSKSKSKSASSTTTKAPEETPSAKGADEEEQQPAVTLNMGKDGEMPSEEEIMEAIKRAKLKPHDEL